MFSITTRDLTRRYGKLVAVDHLNLKIPTGSLFGLIGPNGAGKTTTLRMLAGLLEPSSGEIRINELSTKQYWNEIQWQIGYMPDFFGVYEDLLVWEYLDFFARCYKLEPKPPAAGDRGAAGAGRPDRKARRFRPHPVARHAPTPVPGARPGPRPAGPVIGRAGFGLGPDARGSRCASCCASCAIWVRRSCSARIS